MMKHMKRLQEKIASTEPSKEDVRTLLASAQTLVVKADAFKSVTGAIPESVINAIDSVLRIAVPLTSFLGDFELTGLLNSLKLWLQKKQSENMVEEQRQQGMQGLGFSDYWSM